MKRMIVWLSMLMLALICLSCVKDPVPPVHHHGDPDPIVVEEGKPYCTILVGDDYLSNGQVVETNVEYHYGFRVISNPTTQQDLARFVVTINGDMRCDTVISGKEYNYESTIRFVETREIIGSAEIVATVTDVVGEYNSISIKVDINTPDHPVGGEVQTLPYTQSFASEFGTYMTYDMSGHQSWEIEYNTAKISGYEGATYYANEDWLISSPVALTGVSDAKMTMVYIGRYFDNISEDLTIWASSDYVYGNAPNTATWTRVYADLNEGSNWSDFITTEIALTQFVGQTVTLAVKYVSHAGKSLAGTIEIQRITIKEGSAPGGGGQGSQGSGTAEDPYNVAAGIENQGQDLTAWVRGYIVGAVKSGLASVSSNADIQWSVPFESLSSVVIADDPSCQEITNCIVVNLPAGKPLREQVNLLDHPENLGKRLSVRGVLRTYFGQAGMRDSEGTEADFMLDDGQNVEVQTLPYTQSFNNDFGTYTTYDVEGPQVWGIDYSVAKMSGYQNSTYYANEDWLISSPVAITGVDDAKMAMVYIGRYFDNISEDLTIWVSSDYVYGNEPNTATWSRVYADLIEGSDWNVFITTEIALTQFVGQTVTLAVKYVSHAGKSLAGTIEIQSITIE